MYLCIAGSKADGKRLPQMLNPFAQRKDCRLLFRPEGNFFNSQVVCIYKKSVSFGFVFNR
jgi:hypothetical protein